MSINEAYTHRASEFMTEIRQCLAKLPVQTHISTITVNVKLSKTIHLEEIKANFQQEHVQDFVHCVDGMEGVLFSPTNTKNFSNSLVFKFPSGKQQKAIKVFCNGSLHITGYNDLQKAMYMAEVFAAFLELIEGGDGLQDTFHIREYAIQTINICYKLEISQDMKINLGVLASLLQKTCNYYISFNTDQYVGLVIKAPNFQVLVFESGSVILTCVKDVPMIEMAFWFSHKTLTDLLDQVVADKYTTTRKPKNKSDNTEFDYSKYIVLK